MKEKILTGCLLAVTCALTAGAEERRISVDEYRDKMAAGWIGQMAGVGWGGPTEWWSRGEILAEERVPEWKPGKINQFNQDDIYVEMTFLRTLDEHGMDVSIRQAGIDFANSGYRLWCANEAGRRNLRKGIAPPDSSHPKFNVSADDIDYQIEADYSGLIAPGMINVPIELGEKFGRLMNYGDGMYAGQFVGAMYAEAFFEDDIRKIIEAALRSIPAESQYAEMVRDMLAWHEKNPNDWQKTWQWIEEKYHMNPNYSHGLNRLTQAGGKGGQNIDAKLNGAYILMGLLYGNGDLDQTILISMRCGQDSDCNPSNAAGILFTTLGMKSLPSRYTSELIRSIKFSHTEYDFDSLLEVCEKLARQAVVQQGGRIEKDAGGREVFIIPVLEPRPSELARSWEPGPVDGSRYTEEEMKAINPPKKVPYSKNSKRADIGIDVDAFAPGWQIRDCGSFVKPGLREEWEGRRNVLVTHPFRKDEPCILHRNIDVPTGKKTFLELTVRHDNHGSWKLVVRANGKEILNQVVEAYKWQDFTIDLSGHAGKTIELELLNQPIDWRSWRCEAGYWSRIAIVSK